MTSLKRSTWMRRGATLVVSTTLIIGFAISQMSNVLGAWPVFDAIAAWLADHLVTTSADGRTRLALPGWLVLGTCLLLFAAFVVAVRANLSMSNADEVEMVKGENKELIREIEQEAGSSRDLLKVLYASGFQKHFRFHSILFDHLIGADGGVQIRRELTLSSDDQPVTLLHFREFGDEESAPITTFHQLKLRVTDSRGSRIVVKPLNTDYLTREFVLALANALPRQTPVTITLVFQWTGYFQRAVDYERADYVMNYAATNPSSDTSFTCRFRIARNGPELDFAGVGQLGDVRPAISIDNASGETVWDFVKADLDARRPIEFAITRSRT